MTFNPHDTLIDSKPDFPPSSLNFHLFFPQPLFLENPKLQRRPTQPKLSSQRSENELGSYFGSQGQDEGSFVRVNKIMDIASLEKFLQKQIKVGTTTDALGDFVFVTCEKNKITVTSDSTFSNVPICVEFNSRSSNLFTGPKSTSLIQRIKTYQRPSKESMKLVMEGSSALNGSASASTQRPQSSQNHAARLKSECVAIEFL
ncbi:hypothetical protein ACLB2K_031836 [Fragaria x ananassa]